METITLGKSQLESSRLVYGCMRIAGDGSREDASTCCYCTGGLPVPRGRGSRYLRGTERVGHRAVFRCKQLLAVAGQTVAIGARIEAAKQALDLSYSREDWYRLLEARNAAAVP